MSNKHATEQQNYSIRLCDQCKNKPSNLKCFQDMQIGEVITLNYKEEPHSHSQTHTLSVTHTENFETVSPSSHSSRLERNQKPCPRQVEGAGGSPPTLQSRSTPSSQQHLRLNLHGGGLSPVPLLLRLCVCVCMCESEPPISTRPISSALQGNTST